MGDEHKTIAIPNQIRDAMIVPKTTVRLPIPSRSFNDIEQNSIFGQQWKKFDPTARNLVELKVGGDAGDYLAAIKTASQTARGRDVILAVGHGGANDHRGQTQTVFDSIPDLDGVLQNHKFAITREVIDLPDIAQKVGGRWTPRAVKEPSGVITRVDQSKIDRLSPRFDMLVTSGEIMRAAGVARFVILACNIGKDAPAPGKKGFLELLAGILGTAVVAYKGLVAMGEVTFKDPGVPEITKEQLWIATDENNLDRGRPPNDKPDEASFHEVPLIARVTIAAPTP